MKTPHVLLVSTLFLVGLTAPSLFAQSGFDVKKKKNTFVNTSSLGASTIKQSALKSVAPGSVSIVPQARSFQPPSLIHRLPNVSYSPETGLPSFINSTQNTNAGRLGLSNDIH